MVSVSSRSPTTNCSLIRMMRYNPEAQYFPGKQLVVADTLLRAPQPGEISEIEWEIAADIAAVEQGWPLTTQRLSLIGMEEPSANKENNCMKVKHCVNQFKSI